MNFLELKAWESTAIPITVGFASQWWKKVEQIFFFGQAPRIAYLNRLTGDLVVRNTKRDPQFLFMLAKQCSCLNCFILSEANSLL